jgi:GDP-mannose 6-dehydrogenase
MKIAVFGLGYVGVVTAGCFADDGHEVIGVDVAESKVDLINAGCAPIIEEGVAELLERTVKSGRLRASRDSRASIEDADIALVCVGTPSLPDGGLDQRHVEQVCRDIGECLRTRTRPILLVFRSTMVPGSMMNLVMPALEAAAGFQAGDVYRVVFHPEFLREGSSIADFYHPPKIVVGERHDGDSEVLWRLYPEKYEAPRITCGLEVAEMVKYCDNLFHAVKITFANEIGQFCHSHGIDSQEVMRIFCEDRKLNISASYLKPGFAFGGSCLPKDLRALLSEARKKSLSLPMLQGVLPSNLQQIDRVLSMIVESGARRIGFHGLAFKPGTDDLRESPFVELGERLLGKGKALTFFDEHVNLSRLVGRNRSYIEQIFPHLAEMLTGEVGRLSETELVLLCHRAPQQQIEEWLAAGVRVLDLTGAFSGSGREGVYCVV